MDKKLMDMQRDTIQTAYEYMPKLKHGINSAIKHFRGENNENGVNESSYVEEGLQWLMEVVRLTKDIQTDKMDENLMAEKISIWVNAYENDDYILMGDILEFEINPLLENWDSIIKSLVIN